MKKKTEKQHGGLLIKIILGINIMILIGMGWLYYESQAKIAYVQSGYLLANYQGFKDASAAYQQKSSVWKANIDTLTSQLETKKKEYTTEKNELTPKEIALTKELISTKEQQLIQYKNGIQQKAFQEDKALTAEVVQEVNLFLKEYGQKNGYKIIFGATEAGSIVYAEEALDLTEEVLQALNDQYNGIL